MRTEQLVVRCYAERDRDGSWFAMCIDLNLYARADSLRAAKRQLAGIIVDYVREALTEDRKHAAALIPRPAPLSFFARYYFIKAWCHLFDRKRGGGGNSRHPHILYKDILPVIPA